jgi:hypothetical protein
MIAVGALAAGMLVDRAAGLGVTLVALAVLALAAPPTHPWTLLAAALSLVATVRAAEWIVWPSLAAAYALAALAAAGGAAWRPVGAAIVRGARLDRGLELVARAAAAGAPHRKWRAPLTGAGITVVLLAVFVPLFAGADAAFAHLVGELVPNHALDQPAARAATWVGVIAAGGCLLWTAQQPAAMPAGAARLVLGRTESAVPLVALVALFAVFVALQVHTLFAGHDYVLRTAGVTYAEYAREGFAQLLAASALTLAVIAAAARWGSASRLLLGALCALTLVVLASALTRLDLYVDAYGLTRLRAGAQLAILYLGAVFALVLIAGATRRARWLPRATVTLTGVAILAFAVSDPDRRIAERNLERTGRLDERLLRSLSADAVPALPCRLARIPGEDGLASFNLARARARDAC